MPHTCAHGSFESEKTMERMNLKAQIRDEIGKGSVKKLRRQKFIPAVIYKGKNSQNIKIAEQDFFDIIHTKAGENVIVNLHVAADTAHHKERSSAKTSRRARTAIIKEIQYHPIRGNVLHIDFNEISLTEVLTVKVPIAVKGEAEGIKEGGVLEHILWEIEIECLPTQIPENIPVDVTPLKIGDSILVKDLQLPEGIRVLSDPETTIITLAAPHVEEVTEVKPEEEMAEPEVIMEKKPKEEEVSSEETEKTAKAEKEKK
jgi:large subunit ribosomal protein L25